MPLRIVALFALSFVVAAAPGGARAVAAPPASLPPLPHTVGMSGPDVDLIESGIAAFDRRDLRSARADFAKALTIRSQTAIATFNIGVTDVELGDRAVGKRAMRLGFRLAGDHGMGGSPQAASMRAIACALGVELG